jgi:DNA polymerase elongation subunit (family B)
MLNSLYGVLGLSAFRFHDLESAEAVTLTGQTVIKTTELIANKYYTTNIGDPYEITLENGEVVELGGNAVVTLTNGSTKKVSELTEFDDIII